MSKTQVNNNHILAVSQPEITSDNNNSSRYIAKDDAASSSENLVESDIVFDSEFWKNQNAFYDKNRKKSQITDKKDNEGGISWYWQNKQYTYKKDEGDIKQLKHYGEWLGKWYGVISSKVQKLLDSAILEKFVLSLDIGIVNSNKTNGVVREKGWFKLKIAKQDIRLIATLLINSDKEYLCVFDKQANHEEVNIITSTNHQKGVKDAALAGDHGSLLDYQML
jgi:hypothetical protein